jgi:hypothetical protein
VANPAPATPAGTRHSEVFRIATPAARMALLDELRKTSGPAWVLGKAGPAIDDVEPFRLFLRRAWRVDPPSSPVPLTRADAEALAVSFVKTNAGVLGLVPSDVALLEVTSADVPPADAHHKVAVRFQGKLPMRGFEAFDALATTVDMLLFVDEDAQIRFFMNLSRIHPRLTLDTKPLLDAEDPRLLQHVVGRELFVAFGDPTHPGARVRDLRRESLGRVASSDVTVRTLTVYVSAGPMGAYVAYHLAYAIVVGRGGQWFRFLVSADTGDLLDDAAIPVLGPDEERP